MRIRDYLGFPLLAFGISAILLGHHWLGLIWFWIGFLVAFIGISIVASGGLQEKIDRALRSYRGPGDGGERHYHGGAGYFSKGSSDGDGGDAD